MSAIQLFKNRYQFHPERAFLVGVERECFITNQGGVIVPEALRVLEYVKTHGWQMCVEATDLDRIIGYELSACQVETRTRPRPITEIGSELRWIDEELSCSLDALGLSSSHNEVAPATMPLDVYPDPTGRYSRISKDMPHEILLAACRVIGTHVHVGMPDHETAMRVYDHVTEKCEMLCSLGDHSSGERLAIYRVVAPDATPFPYGTWERFYETACEKGFEEDPRKCWTLIRISGHGTIEFRMFGTTSDISRIEDWVKCCYELCCEAAGR
ncbi:MAG: hypothetical protein AAB582_01030 [Patescibacteria group bacterium]